VDLKLTGKRRKRGTSSTRAASSPLIGTMSYTVRIKAIGGSRYSTERAGVVSYEEHQTALDLLVGILSGSLGGHMSASRLTEITVTAWRPERGPVTLATG
jgi:hypothetical protein